MKTAWDWLVSLVFLGIVVDSLIKAWPRLDGITFFVFATCALISVLADWRINLERMLKRMEAA